MIERRTFYYLALVPMGAVALSLVFLGGCGSDGTNCPASQIQCGDLCVDPKSDSNFCGATDACEGESAGAVCDDGFVCNGSGTCELACQNGLVNCGGTCVDANISNQYCGATTCADDGSDGEICDSGFVCNGAGVCELACQTGLVDCNGTCTDPATSNSYCGATTCADDGSDGEVCDSGTVCNGAGVCELSCQADLVVCGGACTDPQTDETYCGATTCLDDATDGEICSLEEKCTLGVCEPRFAASCKGYFDDGFTTNGSYRLSSATGSFEAFCDMTNGGWTLIARMSNADTSQWIDSGNIWYDEEVAFGATLDPNENLDMLAEGFYKTAGDELRITRSDEAANPTLVETTNSCLGNTDIRSLIETFGDFRTAVWGIDSVALTCAATFSGNFATTSGFEQAACTSDLGAADSVSFFADWGQGDGAVLMIGGGGDACSRADHGLAVTEENSAAFGTNTSRADFGSDGSTGATAYSLNLWVK